MRSPFFDTENRTQSQFRPPPDFLTPYAAQLALSPLQLYCFSRTLTTSSVYLYGAGSDADYREYPLPYDGYLIHLRAWDQITLHSYIDTPVAFIAGDRLSCYAQHQAINFAIKARINGVSRLTTITYPPDNSTVFATLGVRFQRPVS